MKIFNFGANWQNFSRQMDLERVEIAAQSLRSLLQKENINAMSFLDVGCGSGLFSIAAVRLGAVRVVGIDNNPLSVSVSKQNHGKWAPQASINILLGSVLDEKMMDSLGTFDIVYAWGVLHHTGEMWKAIRLVANRVSPGGWLVLAIYNRHVTSPMWRRIKWFYNQLPKLGQWIMTVGFASVIYISKLLVVRNNPIQKERGMDFWYDVIDWIGGYPYEYATLQEIEIFCRSLGFELQATIPAQVPTGCNEFVCKR